MEHAKKKVTFWEAADKYSRSRQAYKETYLRTIHILETWCKDPGRDMIGCHVGDAIKLLHCLIDLHACVWVDYMTMRSIKEEVDD